MASQGVAHLAGRSTRFANGSRAAFSAKGPMKAPRAAARMMTRAAGDGLTLPIDLRGECEHRRRVSSFARRLRAHGWIPEKAEKAPNTQGGFVLWAVGIVGFVFLQWEWI